MQQVVYRPRTTALNAGSNGVDTDTSAVGNNQAMGKMLADTQRHMLEINSQRVKVQAELQTANRKIRDLGKRSAVCCQSDAAHVAAWSTCTALLPSATYASPVCHWRAYCHAEKEIDRLRSEAVRPTPETVQVGLTGCKDLATTVHVLSGPAAV